MSLRQSSKTKIMIHLVPNDFHLPQEKESFQLCSCQKVDDQQRGHEVDEQELVPQTKRKVPSWEFANRGATYIGGAVLR